MVRHYNFITSASEEEEEEEETLFDPKCIIHHIYHIQN